jgi:hypothetical protein
MSDAILPPARTTDGDTLVKASASVNLTLKQITVILAALGLGGGFLTYKAVGAAGTASEAKAAVTVTAEKTAAEGDASYDVWKKRDAEKAVVDAAQTTATNDLTTRLALLERLVLQESSVRGAAAYRARKKPPLPAPVPAPAKAPPPATPEAAAAAAPATPTSAGDKP